MNPCHGDNLCPYFLDNLPGFPASGDQWETTTLTCLIRRCWELPFGDLVMLSAVYCIYMCLLSAVHTCIYIYIYTNNKNNTDNGNNTSIDYDDDDDDDDVNFDDDDDDDDGVI